MAGVAGREEQVTKDEAERILQSSDIPAPWHIQSWDGKMYIGSGAYSLQQLEAFVTLMRSIEPSATRVCPDSEDGNHVLKQDGPFSVVYCDACGMNRGWRGEERTT